MQEQPAMYSNSTGKSSKIFKEDVSEKSREREMGTTTDNGADGMKLSKSFYREMGGLPQIRMPPVRYKDESFRIYGRQVPRTPNVYKWGR